jgi:hypothetical protein
MTANLYRLSTTFFIVATSVFAGAQSSSLTGLETQQPPPPSVVASAVQVEISFKDSDVKFDLSRLMLILRDKRHEGWVLAAYPDPKTRSPLIGAGFTLDLPARQHAQRDLLNIHQFLEPSSAELWQAAGLDPARLDKILAHFAVRQSTWSKKRFRKEVRNLDPEITDEDATFLLRISAIQAINNARAYCRNFDELTASQQMAMTQLVYQMGVNLEQFSTFLGLINHDYDPAPLLNNPAATDPGYWRNVQLSLTQSQWARLYRTRATAVIAMLDPQYTDDPSIAEHHIGAVLRPAVAHRRAGRSRGTVRAASLTRHRSLRSRRRTGRTRKN